MGGPIPAVEEVSVEVLAVLMVGGCLLGALALLAEEVGAASAGAGLGAKLREAGLVPVLGGLALGGVVAFAWPVLLPHPRPNNETSVIGALKGVRVAQALYREQDRDGNGVQDYAPSLAALGSVELRGGPLIDGVLGTGTKQGYCFRMERLDGERWRIWADPTIPGTTGDRHFAADQSGTIWHSSSGSVVFQADGSTDARRLGQ